VAHFGSLGALGSDYGLALVLKVVLLGAALATALFRRHRLELGLLAAAAGAAAVLAALPPPR
ncbi:MAG TPA: hypothetical protein VEW68_06745, partial [Patescibacteria group bacterium]|nr:hypothetical protein [Patescibacteria group bacterium]